MKSNPVVALLALLLPAVAFGMAPRPKTPDDQPAPYANPVNPKDETEKATKYFKGKILIPEVIYPTRALAAFVVLDKEGNVKTVTRLLPDKAFPEPEMTNDTIFEAIVDKSFTASAKYLAFVDGELKGQDKAAVALRTVFRAKGPEFFSTEVQACYKARLAELPLEEGDEVYYTEAVQLLLSTSSVLSTDSAKASGAFVVQAAGQTLYSNTRSQSARITVVEGVKLKYKLEQPISDRALPKQAFLPLGEDAVSKEFPVVFTKATKRLQ